MRTSPDLGEIVTLLDRFMWTENTRES
jgi:hypothetical protein